MITAIMLVAIAIVTIVVGAFVIKWSWPVWAVVTFLVLYLALAHVLQAARP